MGQGDSARDFDASESMKNAGILDVFPIFYTARLGQKIRRSPQFPLCGVALRILILVLLSPSAMWQIFSRQMISRNLLAAPNMAAAPPGIISGGACPTTGFGDGNVVHQRMGHCPNQLSVVSGSRVIVIRDSTASGISPKRMP